MAKLSPAAQINPVSHIHTRHAAVVASRWPFAPRRARRAGVRWWWRSCRRTAFSWKAQWQEINANRGVVYPPLAELSPSAEDR